MHCRMFSSIPGLYPLDACSTFHSSQPNMSPDFVKCLLEKSALCPQLRTASFKGTCGKTHTCLEGWKSWEACVLLGWDGPVSRNLWDQVPLLPGPPGDLAFFSRCSCAPYPTPESSLFLPLQFSCFSYWEPLFLTLLLATRTERQRPAVESTKEGRFCHSLAG